MAAGQTSMSALLGAVFGLCSLAAAGEAPRRIVSLNLCTDQLLMQMAEPGRIVAISHLASDPRSSAMADEAAAHAAVRGTAEEVIALRPDLILTGSFSTRETTAMLKRLGYRVETFVPASSIDEMRSNIARLGAILGEEARAEEMTRIIDDALEDAPAEPSSFVYVAYGVNGWIAGETSLLTDIANAAGFTTLGQKLGFRGMRQVSLEQLLVAAPDLIDLGNDFSDFPSLQTDQLSHPALHHLTREKETVAIPGRLTTCGTPRAMEALSILIAKRRAMEAAR